MLVVFGVSWGWMAVSSTVGCSGLSAGASRGYTCSVCCSALPHWSYSPDSRARDIAADLFGAAGTDYEREANSWNVVAGRADHPFSYLRLATSATDP